MGQFWFIPIKWQNFYLGKDVCQVPLQLKNEFGYTTKLVFIGKYYINEIPPKEFQGMEIIVLKSYLHMIIFFLKVYGKIDLFGTFHFHRYSLFFVILYKILKPRGKVILKSDISYDSTLQLVSFVNNFIYFRIITYLLGRIDFFTVESKNNLNILQNTFKSFSDKFIFVSNGFDKGGIQHVNLNKKENIIVVIGNIGDKNKNHGMLIQAIKNINVRYKWKVIFIGNIIENFDKRTMELFNHENIKIHFTGPIYDKNELYNYLSKSKVFCHTSFFEGDPLVQYEAMFYGLYCVSTDCGTIKENYPDFFSSISPIGDVDEYQNNLEYVLNYFEGGNQSDIQDKINKCHEYCEQNFLWHKTIINLINKIKGTK